MLISINWQKQYKKNFSEKAKELQLYNTIWQYQIDVFNQLIVHDNGLAFTYEEALGVILKPKMKEFRFDASSITLFSTPFFLLICRISTFFCSWAVRGLRQAIRHPLHRNKSPVSSLQWCKCDGLAAHVKGIPKAWAVWGWRTLFESLCEDIQ